MTDEHCLVVLEGPAGSGKSFIQDLLREKHGMPELFTNVQLQRPRDYGYFLAPYLSQLKDFQVLQEMAAFTMSPVIRTTTRWCLSQLVYHALRKGEKALDIDPTLVSRVLESMAQMYTPAATALFARSGGIMGGGDVRPLWIHTHLLLPRKSYISFTRNKGAGVKTYPFSIESELAAYNQVFNIAQDLPKTFYHRIFEDYGVRYTFTGTNLVELVDAHSTAEIIQYMVNHPEETLHAARDRKPVRNFT